MCAVRTHFEGVVPSRQCCGTRGSVLAPLTCKGSRDSRSVAAVRNSAFRTSSFTMSHEHNHRRNQWYRKGCREHHEQFSTAEGDCLEHRLQRRNIHRAQNYRRGGKRRKAPLFPAVISAAMPRDISRQRRGYIHPSGGLYFLPFGQKANVCALCAHILRGECHCGNGE